MKDTHLLVIQLMDQDPVSWEAVGEEMGIPVRIVGPDAAAAGKAAPASPDAGVTPSPVATVVRGTPLALRDWFDDELAESLTSGPSDVFAACTEGSHRLAAQLVRRGAADFFQLPQDLETFINAVGLAARTRQQVRGEAVPDEAASAEAFATMIGESPAIRAVVKRAQRILAHRDATALLVGETGTGKEVLARAIHDGGPRRNAPFVAVNCASIPATLFESELFGHQRGAFTDANQEKPGLIETADGGTVFFDELGLLPFDLQSKLLRVLEDRRVRRLGSTQDRELDVRILAATNSDLESAVRAGTFREDFFYRLAVIRLELPPLRDRGDDVLKIARVLLSRLARQHNVPEPTLNATVSRHLLAHSWPGNVRELRNALERSLLLSPPGRLTAGELGLGDAPARPSTDGNAPVPTTLRDITARAARGTVERCGGNRSEAARILDISRARLRRLLSDPPDPPAS